MGSDTELRRREDGNIYYHIIVYICYRTPCAGDFVVKEDTVSQVLLYMIIHEQDTYFHVAFTDILHLNQVTYLFQYRFDNLKIEQGT